MKIVYAGGGTMGPVSPLLAVHNKLVSEVGYEALWIGTKKGVEKQVVESQSIAFKSIFSGKLRRYFSLQNIADISLIKIGIIQSFFILASFKPQVVVSAGGFVAVPVVIAASFLRIPVLIHQQDIRPGLANKLCAPFAKKITVATEKSLEYYKVGKTVVVGNPVRSVSGSQHSVLNIKLEKGLPVVLIMGGGTGAVAINKLVEEGVGDLVSFCQVVHVTGKNKNQESRYKNRDIKNYQVFEFIDDLYKIYPEVDVVVARAGFSTLTELAYYKKPAIIIPMSGTHQEDNARYFAEKNACIYLKQKEIGRGKFIKEIKTVLDDKKKQEELSENINKIFVDYSGDKMVKEILELV